MHESCCKLYIPTAIKVFCRKPDNINRIDEPDFLSLVTPCYFALRYYYVKRALQVYWHYICL